MLLANPHFSHIYSYIEAINKIKNASFSCAYKSDEVTKGDTIYFRCFNLESTIQLNPESLFASSIIVKDARYNGTLSFSYNETTKQIFIDTVPYVVCGTTKIPLFTSDIARIVREKIERITPIPNTHIVFKDPILVLAEDASVIDVLPQVKETSNHKFFTNAMAEIEREKEIIAADIARCKRREERRINEEENAFRRKRRIYGIDPEGLTMEEFKRKLGEAQVRKYKAKLKGLEKNQWESINEYYATLIDSSLPEDKERLFQYELYLVYIIIRNLYQKGKITEKAPLYSIPDRYKNLTEEEYRKVMREIVSMTNLETIELVEYLHNLRNGKMPYNKQTLKEIVKIFYDYDLNIVVPCYYDRVVGYNPPEEIDWDTPCLDAYNKPGISGHYNILEAFLSGTHTYPYGIEVKETPAKYHPLLYKGYALIGKLREKYSEGIKELEEEASRTLYYEKIIKKYDENTIKLCAELKESKIDFPGLGIIVKMARLDEKVRHYQELLEQSPIKIAEKFLERPVVWGQEKTGILLQAPYFREIQFANNGSYGLMMIRPGVKECDPDTDDDMKIDKCDGLVTFVDTSELPGVRSSKESYVLGYMHKSWQFRAISKYIITVPDSLDIESIKSLYGLVFESENVIFICQSVETAIKVKKILAIVVGRNLADQDNNESASIIVDPNYYANFVKGNYKVNQLWEKYEKEIVKPENLDYTDKMELLHVFCYNLSVTRVNQGIMVDMYYANRVFDEIAFGGFNSRMNFEKELEDFNALLGNPKERVRLMRRYRSDLHDAIRAQDEDQFLSSYFIN